MQTNRQKNPQLAIDGTAALESADRIIEIVPYESRLNRDLRYALSETSLFFEGKGSVLDALRKITRRLAELEIPYCVVGGLALVRHGYRRYTEDVDLLVTKESLKLIHEKLDGLGYLPPFTNSKHLRDTDLGVKIEFLTTGDFPGDGKPKPVAFPDPVSVSAEADGIQFVNLPTLLELKLASGMTNAARMKDITDVLELLKILKLSSDYAQRLNPFVRQKFAELQQIAQAGDPSDET